MNEFKKYFEAVINQMAKENPKTPIGAFRIEEDEDGGRLFGPSWFQYMIYGRGPGKQPPPNKILKWVQRNPELLADAKTKYKYITERGLAFIIGRKIGREGTDIYLGKRKGVDLLGAMEDNMPGFLKDLVRNEMVKFHSSFQKAIK